MTSKMQSKPDNGFDIMAAMTNFKPASVDPERLFSYGRISKNYLQNRLSLANHDRNVFLSKNQHLNTQKVNLQPKPKYHQPN